MALFVVAHGAWSAGWAWTKMQPLMAVHGHRLITPSYTGLGERGHLANRDIDLETHIGDMLAVLQFEDLRDVVLLGHSYGGMVATGVADRARERMRTLVYLDAFVPRDGESAFDLMPQATRDQRRAGAQNGNDSWRIPPGPMPPDTPDADREWAEPRRLPQPLKTFEQKLSFKNGDLTLPRHYIYCARRPPDDRFRPFYERAKEEALGCSRDRRQPQSAYHCAGGAGGFARPHCQVMNRFGRGERRSRYRGLPRGARNSAVISERYFRSWSRTSQ